MSSVWKIELDEPLKKQLAKLDRQIAKRITDFLHERVARLDDPRSIGESLTGSRLGDLWKYRVGNYRVLCDIQDDRLVILTVKVGHRREVYRP
jgi:mRNA interferase RelE/StbE